MKYVDEFRDPVAARGVLAAIARTVDAIGAIKEKPIHIMEICGGHTHAIFRYGLDKLTPPGLEFIHGPGCPVCVLPMPRVDEAVEIAERHGVIFTTFGDAMRVPGTKKSLLQAKADGADIRMVYSPLDALDLARRNPRPRHRVLRSWLRNDDALDRLVDSAGGGGGADQFQRLLQSHHRAAADQGLARRSLYDPRRLCRAGPCFDGHRHASL